PLHQVDQRFATFGDGGDVEKHQFVGALLIVHAGAVDRVAGVLDVDEANALDHLAVLDVQAGDDAFGQTHVGLHCETKCRAAAKSSVPSYRARPMTAPATPSSSAAHSARMSSRLVTPPEAMTGIVRLAASSRVASMLSPCT